MDKKNKIPNLIFFIFSLILFINHVSGMDVRQPVKLEVNISDGEVIVFWEHPVDIPTEFGYNVEMTRYQSNDWTPVSGCSMTRNHFCVLTSLIDDYGSGYKVRVQLVTGTQVSAWIYKKFLPNRSGLLPPAFSLWATSSTLTVKVHEKPILKKLFPFGVIYTIYLEELGQDNKTTTAYLRDEGEEEQRKLIFTALHWGREYCVGIEVEGTGSLSKSSMSPQQCLHLPEQEWFIVAASSLSLLGAIAVVAIMGSILLCYLRRPAKTPAALKSPVGAWLPLSVTEETMEVVTDKGWFLYSYGPAVKNSFNLPVTHVTITEDSEEDRRTSMDSGVNIESNSTTDNGTTPPMRQEDSGCGSMGGPESSTSSQVDYTLKDERTEHDEVIVRKREDSGVGMGCRLESSSINMDEQESAPLMKCIALQSYRSQNPSVVQNHECGNEDMFKQLPADSILAEVVAGYRAGPQSCICSGAGQCSWCHKHNHYGTEATRHYRAVGVENGPLGSESHLIDSQNRGGTLSGYSSEPHMDMMNECNVSALQMSQTFPLLTSLPLVKCGQDINMNNLPLSLCDVQLTSD
ncbi:interleukin-10 receptor subunit alpha [Cololabis saira]|uniref:interleukin-10 receptor subunit alpha n=1 Tax=Cololabis saira TaxID=129043 RepID=UPI002AD5AA04|nr:interleukin-10 receptor subunit alpha [Cololabis saira]